MERRKELFFLYNPVAGRGRVIGALPNIIDKFTRAGFLVTCCPTASSGDAELIASDFDAQRYDILVVSGGDGTLDEVVRSLMKRKDLDETVTLGYIPGGTTNDFGASHGLPADPMEAADVIINGKTESYDIGRLGKGAYFIYVAAFGNFAHISYDTPQNMKNVFGHAAYMFRGIPELMQFSKIVPYHIRAVADGKTYENDYAVGLISNTNSIAGFSGVMGDGVDMQDGLFEVTLIKMPKVRRDVNTIINHLLSGRFEKKYMDHFSASELIMDSETPLSFSLDGEFGGEWEHAELSVLNRKLKIRVPK